MSRLRIVLAHAGIARYPQGGGHWTLYTQYWLGLDALGHDLFHLELLRSTGNRGQDEELVGTFFRRLRHYGLADRCGLLLWPKESEQMVLEAAEAHGKSKFEIKELVKRSDLLWNFACAVRQPLLSLFPYRVLIDLDPGHLQVASLTADMDLHHHHRFLTVGSKMGDPDCEVPNLGLEWRTFRPFVHLPMWKPCPDPGPAAPFSSITHWTWEELWLRDRVLSVSKRDAYLRYFDLPQKTKRPFELASLIYPGLECGDRELLERNGWNIVHPWEVAGSPSLYQHYISKSRAEISCSKPIYRELKTGWFSDRSACYLASGRPVLAEETGFSEHLPTGAGLLAFRDMLEAVEGVAEIDSNYDRHRKAARQLAEEFLDARRGLQVMLAACG